MIAAIVLATAGLLDLSASFFVEIIAFLVMLGLLAWFVYPRVIAAATERQRMVAKQLEAAERTRQEAEQRLNDAEAKLQEARAQAAQVIEGAGRSADQLRAELRERAEEEAKRLTDGARKDIEAERQKAVDSVRGHLADLVVSATEKVVGESLDGEGHRRLIERAISEIESGR